MGLQNWTWLSDWAYCKQMDAVPKLRNKVVRSYRSVAEWDRSKNPGVSNSPRFACMVLWRTYGTPSPQDKPLTPVAHGQSALWSHLLLLLPSELGSGGWLCCDCTSVFPSTQSSVCATPSPQSGCLSSNKILGPSLRNMNKPSGHSAPYRWYELHLSHIICG